MDMSAAYMNVVDEGAYRNHAVYSSDTYDMYTARLTSVVGESTMRKSLPVMIFDIQWGPKKRYEK